MALESSVETFHQQSLSKRRKPLFFLSGSHSWPILLLRGPPFNAGLSNMYGWILQGTNLSPTGGKSRAGRWGKKGMRFGKGARERLPGCNAQLLTGQMGTGSFFRQKESSMVDGSGQGSWALADGIVLGL